jgi:hypothetical protein
VVIDAERKEKKSIIEVYTGIRMRGYSISNCEDGRSDALEREPCSVDHGFASGALRYSAFRVGGRHMTRNISEVTRLCTYESHDDLRTENGP